MCCCFKLHGMDIAEAVSVKAVLMRAAQQFQDITGRTRRFVLSFKKHDSAHPNHLALDSGSGLIHLLKWIVQDQLELASLDYLLPHEHNLCANCKSGLIARSQLLTSTCLDDVNHLVVFKIGLCEVTEDGNKTEMAASFAI